MDSKPITTNPEQSTPSVDLQTPETSQSVLVELRTLTALAKEQIALFADMQKAHLGQKAVLSFEEASVYTGYKESYMYQLTSKGQIPHCKPNGKSIFFDRSKLDAWLLSNPVKTTEEIESEAMSYITRNKKGSK